MNSLQAQSTQGEGENTIDVRDHSSLLLLLCCCCSFISFLFLPSHPLLTPRHPQSVVGSRAKLEHICGTTNTDKVGADLDKITDPLLEHLHKSERRREEQTGRVEREERQCMTRGKAVEEEIDKYWNKLWHGCMCVLWLVDNGW